MIRSYSNDELIKLMDETPLPIQQAIESKSTIAIISGLGTRLGLHIDIIAKIAALNVQMLLGLVSPEEFLKELIAAGVSDADARQIMTEINQKIFVPLREQIRNGIAAASQIAKPVEPAVASSQPMNIPVPDYAPRPPESLRGGGLRPPEVKRPADVMEPPPQSPTYFHSENRIASQPSISIIRPPTGGNERRPPRPVVAVPPKPIPDEKLLEDHEEAHIDFDKTSVPPNLPGTMPSIQPKPVPPTDPIPLVPPIPSKPYSVDPYREPLDEN